MANVKNGAFREMIIDRCLQSRRGFSIQEILDKCNTALTRRGDEPVTASNTIRNDIMSIENRYHVVVEQVRKGRNIRYRYRDVDFSIFNTPLGEDEIMQLSESVALLRRFEGMPGFEWVDELNAHIESTVYVDTQPIVGFDENAELKGMEFFTPLFNYIKGKQAILLRYKPYEAEKVMEVVVHPYYMKEYNQRWFLFGLDDKYKRLCNFALDRIDSVESATKKYIENTDIDFETYFDDIIGVTNIAKTEVEEISLWVSKDQLPYILSKPLHKSQILYEEHKDGSGIITIEVKPNFELKQLLLSFGERATVLSPKHLREEILDKIKKNYENYK